MTNSADPDQLKKPTDLDLHCLQRQGISGFSRTRVNLQHMRYPYFKGEKTPFIHTKKHTYASIQSDCQTVMPPAHKNHIGDSLS